MKRKNNGGIKLLKISGAILLIIGGISAFAKYLVDSNYLGVLISAIAFFVGIWLIGQIID